MHLAKHTLPGAHPSLPEHQGRAFQQHWACAALSKLINAILCPATHMSSKFLRMASGILGFVTRTACERREREHIWNEAF